MLSDEPIDHINGTSLKNNIKINKNKDIMLIVNNITLLKEEFNEKNDRIKGFNIVKKTKTGDSLYIALTFSGKVLEKINTEGWKQTYPNV